MEFTREARGSRQCRELGWKLDSELTPDRERKLPMMRRLLFKPVILQPMTWLVLCLLVTSGGLAQEPVPEPTAPPWPQGLISAIKANDLPAVKESLEKGAEVEARNKNGGTPLMFAAQFSSTPEIVTLLLAKGAEIEARDNGGWTPLMYAAAASSTPEIVTLLLEKGADALAKDEDGKKAIDHAQGNDKLKGTKAYWKLHDQSVE